MAAARAVVKHDDWAPAWVVGVLLAELDARGVAIERVRELHRPIEEQSYVRPDGSPVLDTVCTVCVYTGDDYDPAGNRFRYREHADWPCETVQVLDGRP
jgi:hypothetical protein